MSRNWTALGNFGFHFGLNKNLTESDDKDDDINMFFGFDKELNKSFLIYGEYNFANNTITKENYSVKIKSDKTLAGSIVTMDQTFRNLISMNFYILLLFVFF